ncbi:MAG: SIMPL domain-containing protein, partial [Paracoccaceae bacterium]
DSAVQDGANSLNGVTFGLQDQTAALDDARRAAIADAQRKANLYAEAAGVSLGGVLSISEQGSSQPPYMPVRMEMAAKSADVPVSAGELSLGVTVTVTFAIGQ